MIFFLKYTVKIFFNKSCISIQSDCRFFQNIQSCIHYADRVWPSSWYLAYWHLQDIGACPSFKLNWIILNPEPRDLKLICEESNSIMLRWGCAYLLTYTFVKHFIHRIMTSFPLKKLACPAFWLSSSL